MNYYWFSKQEILQKAKKKKKNTQNKEAIKENSRERYKNLS